MIEAVPKPAKIAFTTSPYSLKVNVTFDVMSVEIRDASNNPIDVTGSTIIRLSSSSGSGKFYDAPGGSLITSITITSGHTVSFYYKDSLSGTPTITVGSTGLTSATQKETITK